MLEPEKYRYSVVLLTEKGKRHGIAGYIENLVWEEPKKELAARITFTARNDKTSKGRLSSLAKPGCYVAVMYAYDNGKTKEAVRGKIVEWNPSAKASKEQFRVKAYDCLYDLQESSDNVFFSSGVKTKSAITQIFKSWKVPVGKYEGPNVTHGKLVYKNEKIGTIVLKILKKAKRKGGKESVLRSVKGKVHVLPYGNNESVYRFVETKNVLSSSHKISTVGMVTRVKVIGKEKKNGSAPVEAVVDGKTKYGIRQKIYIRGDDESLKEAKGEAESILKDDGKPKEEITVKTPDLPIMRKGDRIHLKLSTAGKGYYYVEGIRHDCDGMTMEMDLKRAK